MLRYYLKLGLLSIRANPALSALMVAAIAIGIGACMTIVTIQHVMSGDPIPHKSDQLYHVQLDSWSPDNPYDSPNDLPYQLTYLDSNALATNAAAFRQTPTFKTSRVVEPSGEDARPFRAEGRAASADFFAMFDAPFLYGGAWDDSADRAEERVTVLGRALSEQLFGADNPVGEMITFNGELFRITGVLDDWSLVPKFYDLNNNPFEETEQFFAPFSLAVAGEWGSDGNTNCWKPVGDGGRDAFLASECIWIQYWVELRNASEREDYLQYLNDYVEQQKELGRFPRPVNNAVSNVEEWMVINEVVDEDVGVLLGLAILFLVVCLLNTIGLLLAKVIRRGKDISLRRALGASKATLFGQYIIEAGMIGVGGGVLGIGMTWLGLRGIENIFSEYDFIQNLVRMDWMMVLLAVALAVVSALCAALYPTWRACNITPASQLRIQ